MQSIALNGDKHLQEIVYILLLQTIIYLCGLFHLNYVHTSSQTFAFIILRGYIYYNNEHLILFFSYWPIWCRQVAVFMQQGALLLVPIAAFIQTWRYMNKGPPDILDVSYLQPCH